MRRINYKTQCIEWVDDNGKVEEFITFQYYYHVYGSIPSK